MEPENNETKELEQIKKISVDISIRDYPLDTRQSILDLFPINDIVVGWKNQTRGGCRIISFDHGDLIA